MLPFSRHGSHVQCTACADANAYSSRKLLAHMGKTVAVCQFGGELVPDKDGNLSYTGGVAHALLVVPDMKFDDFKSEVAEMCNRDPSTLSFKYFLPSHRRTPIMLSTDKDMQRMIQFHEESATIDVVVSDIQEISRDAAKAVTKRQSSSMKKSRTRSEISAARKTRTKSAQSTVDNGDESVSITASADASTPIVSATPISASAANGSNPKLRGLLCISPENVSLKVGQEFNDTRDIRDTLRAYAIRKGFVCKYVRKESKRVTVKCNSEGCPWRLRALRVSISQKFKVTTLNDEHTCGGGVGEDGHPNATRRWVASVIKDKLRDIPDYQPKDIVDDIYQEYGVKITYHQAWRGKEIAQELLRGCRAEEYHKLPWLCDKIRETNPGCHVILTTTEESRFHRIFISYHASQQGFKNGCRPQIFLDGSSLGDRCRGTLLAAASVDGDDGIFPIAFAIVDSETYDNWHWFLGELKIAISTDEPLTFVSDRSKGLDEAVLQVFQDSYHAYSLHHLTEEFKRVLEGLPEPVKNELVDEFLRSAFSCNDESFDACIDSIRNVSQGIAGWVLETKPQHWSNAFFRGLRYDYVSSNIADLFFSWLPEQEFSIIEIINIIQSKMIEMISARRDASVSWTTTLTPTMEQRLQTAMFGSCSLNVLQSSGTVFEVRDDLVNVVDTDTWVCSCGRWKMSGLPCVHAAAVLDRTGRNVYDCCSKYFTAERYRLAYSESIHPILDPGKPGNEEESSSEMVVSNALIVHPPDFQRLHRRRGRPKKKRLEVAPEPKKMVRLQHCSNCGVPGHNKVKCKVPLQNANLIAS